MVETKIQMRFADVDMLGHVNNVNLQHYFDMGKSNYFSEVLQLPINWHEEGLIQKATNITYEAQTRFNEPIVVTTKIEKLGTKSITFLQQIINTETLEVKAIATSVLVAFNFDKQHTIEIPTQWREKVEEYEKY